VNNACKRNAIDDLFSLPTKIILNVLGQTSANCSYFNNSDVHKIRKNINAAGQALLPSVPKNIKEIHLVLDDLEIKTSIFY